MRLHILADQHQEFGEVKIPPTEADVVILAGDIDVGRKGLDWAKIHFGGKPVIYVLGNHEFYRHAIPELTEQLQRESKGTQIHLLEDEAVELAGFTFLGCTLWTDFALNSRPEDAMKAAEAMMNDYRIIDFSPEKRELRARDTQRIHQRSVAWLREQLVRHDPARTIVVTHYAPSPQSEDPYYKNGPLPPSFASDLNALIEGIRIPLWIHGHTHYCVDHRIGLTRVLSNQRGYPGEPCKRFDPGLVVEL
jgi:predicted phosphohydrolase